MGSFFVNETNSPLTFILDSLPFAAFFFVIVVVVSVLLWTISFGMKGHIAGWKAQDYHSWWGTRACDVRIFVCECICVIMEGRRDSNRITHLFLSLTPDFISTHACRPIAWQRVHSKVLPKFHIHELKWTEVDTKWSFVHPVRIVRFCVSSPKAYNGAIFTHYTVGQSPFRILLCLDLTLPYPPILLLIPQIRFGVQYIL